MKRKNERKAAMMQVFFVLAIVAPTICHATSLVFDSNGTIDGGTYQHVTITDTAIVGMNDGSVDQVGIYNFGILNAFNGTISQAILWDSGKLNLEGATFENTLTLYNSSSINLNSGTLGGLIYGYDNGRVTVNGGQVSGAGFDMSSYAMTDIYSGNVTIDSLSLHQYSAFNIWGGDVSFVNGFSLHDDAEINVFYSAVILDKPGGIIVGYYLLDNSEFMLDQFTQSEIGQINFVPEPATLLLLGLGGLIVRKRSKKLFK